jgi:hypothetical protein
VVVADGGTTTVNFALSPIPASPVKVAGIDPWTEAKGKSGKVKLFIKITVTDGEDAPVEGADVSLELNPPPPEEMFSGQGLTGSDGTVTFEKPEDATNGSYTATVTDIQKDGHIFDPGDPNNAKQFMISDGQVEGAIASGEAGDGSQALLIPSGTATKPSAGRPAVYALSQNAPNPFNAVTAITYDLPQAGHVALTVYTLTGQRVAVLVDTHQEAGHHTTLFDGSGYANGIYLYRLHAGAFAQTRRMLVVK